LKARRREQAMVLPAIGLGLCLVGAVVLAMFLSTDRGRPGKTGWNEDLKEKLERLLVDGVQKSAGRQLYSDIDTALEGGHNGEWKVGEGLTLDKQPYTITVRDKKLEMRPMSRSEAVAAGLERMSSQSSLETGFQHRSQSLVVLSQPTLRLVAAGDGKFRLQGRVFGTVKARKSVEDVALLVRRRTQQGRRVQTQALFQHFPWRQLSTRFIDIDVEAPDPPPAAGDSLELVMIAFLEDPKPSLYRISNEATCIVSRSEPAAIASP
jgi:hypothetical protein